MNLKSANPILHTSAPQDLSGIFDDATWKGHLPATSSPLSKPQLQQPILPPHSLVSPIASYNTASTGHMPTQPVDRDMRGVNLKANQQQPHVVPMTSLSMPSTANLTEEPLPHSLKTPSLTQLGSVMKTSSTYNQPSHVDYRIPRDNSRDPPPHDEMVLHPHTNMTKASIYSQTHHPDYRIPQVSREASTILQGSREPMSHDELVSQGYMANTPMPSLSLSHPSLGDYGIPHVSREPLTRDFASVPNNHQSNSQQMSQGNMTSTKISPTQPSHGDYTSLISREPQADMRMVSPTQISTAQAPMAFVSPPHQGHVIANDPARHVILQSHPHTQPATRDPLEYNRSMNMNASQINSDPLVTTKPTKSIPLHFQSVPYSSSTDMNYMNQPHSALPPQHPSDASSLPSNGNLPKMHTNLPAGSTDGASNYSPAKSIPERGYESEYMSPRLKTLSHDSLHHEMQPPSSNNVMHPELERQHNRATLPPSTEIYNSKTNLLVKREIPEKDTNVVRGSMLRQDPVEVHEVLSTVREGEQSNKTIAVPNVDDKPTEMFGSRRYYDEGTQNDSPERNETKRNQNSNLPVSKPYENSNNLSVSEPYAAPTHSPMDSREYNGRTSTPERTTMHNVPSTSTGATLIKDMHDFKSHTEPSLSSVIQTTANVQQENDHKPSQVQTTEDTRSLPELQPAETTAYNSEMDNRMTPLTQQQSEAKQEDVEFSDKKCSTTQDSPFPAPTKYNSPDRQSSSSNKSPSLATTKSSSVTNASALPSEIRQDELKNPDRYSSSSKESPPSPPTKSNTRLTPALPSKPPVQNVDDSDTDFFDQNINVTNSAAYRSLVGDMRKGSDGTDSEIDEAEGQVSAIISKPQTPLSRPTFKPFAASIPSLRPALPDTDTDSVDSVEAAIQAAMKKKDLEAVAESPRETPQPPPSSSLKQEAKSETAAEMVKPSPIKPGIDKTPGKKTQNTATALQINLDSECESYEVSAGGDASDEDDFDFYDKF
ncbi:mucin-4-like isoform X2 [Scylla paramamosain]